MCVLILEGKFWENIVDIWRYKITIILCFVPLNKLNGLEDMRIINVLCDNDVACKV